MTELINSKTFFDVAVTAAKEAGQYQKFKLHSGFQIEYKSNINLVTEVDRACESMIVKTIQKRFPDHDIMAEEGSGQRKNSPYKWIIDPLDGTTNYAHGYPFFATSIGLEYQGKIIGGVVYDPMRDELFQGFQDEGSFLNQKKIHVSCVSQLNRAMVATGFAYNHRESSDNDYNHFQNMMRGTQAVRRDGTAALDICYVACGRFDGFWELNLFPWDTAAGLVIALEAGARVSRFKGSSYTIYEKDILLTNSHVHDEMIETLRSGLREPIF